ncbi:MAG: hypothetical protein HYW33_00340 [Candidatus Blackburnbacteria bacterium]|nr:hypothetical protein [Candidatus Blackburnbacteria bacterium]
MNGTDEGEDGHHPYYLVSGSESYFSSMIPEEVRRAQQAIGHYLATVVYPNDPVVWVDLEEVRNLLKACVGQITQTLGDIPIVSLSPLYYPYAEEFIDCNRIVSTGGFPLGLGPRPGKPDLQQQVAQLIARHPGQSFVLVDDMLFHGETVVHLQSFGLPVLAVAAAFSTAEGKELLEERGVKVWVGHSLGTNLRDMMPLHDFLPPLPLCGKVVGNKIQTIMPTSMNGLSFSLPYLLPWVTPSQLASIASVPEQHALGFSALCLNLSMDIFSALADKRNIRRVVDLKSFEPRASCPYVDEDLCEDEEIVEMLDKARDRLGLPLAVH